MAYLVKVNKSKFSQGLSGEIWFISLTWQLEPLIQSGYILKTLIHFVIVYYSIREEW